MYVLGACCASGIELHADVLVRICLRASSRAHARARTRAARRVWNADGSATMTSRRGIIWKPSNRCRCYHNSCPYCCDSCCCCCRRRRCRRRLHHPRKYCSPTTGTDATSSAATAILENYYRHYLLDTKPTWQFFCTRSHGCMHTHMLDRHGSADFVCRACARDGACRHTHA